MVTQAAPDMRDGYGLDWLRAFLANEVFRSMASRRRYARRLFAQAGSYKSSGKVREAEMAKWFAFRILGKIERASRIIRPLMLEVA